MTKTATPNTPAGTRVTVTTGKYAGRTGTVLDHNHGTVDNPAHPNHGRAYLMLALDKAGSDFHNPWTRQFVEDLQVNDTEQRTISAAGYGVFNDEGCTDVFDSLEEAEERADEYKAEDDGYYADLIEVHEICADHEEQPKDGCEECAVDGDEPEEDEDPEDDDEEMQDDEPSTPRDINGNEFVDFDDIQVGDELVFSTRDSGFGGRGHGVDRAGVVTAKTNKTITVKVVGNNPFVDHVFRDGKARELGYNARLLRSSWYDRSVRRTKKAAPASTEPSIVFEPGQNRPGGAQERRWGIGGRPSRDRAEARNILTDHYGWDPQDAEQALEDAATDATREHFNR